MNTAVDTLKPGATVCVGLRGGDVVYGEVLLRHANKTQVILAARRSA